MAKKKSKKDKPANKRYKAASRWLENAVRNQKRHAKRVAKKEEHMERRAEAGKKTSADLRWKARRQGKDAFEQNEGLNANPYGSNTTMGNIWTRGWRAAEAA